MEPRVVLGGRGNLGIINTLRRQIIHIVNWELNTSKDKGIILELLTLLITSVGSEHYRSLAAIEILQCIDNVLRKLVDNKTRNSWVLLLSHIGKHNVIFRDYVLYRTLNLLKDQDKNDTLQNLEARCIHWRLNNNLLYSLYSLILRDDDVSNEDVKKCMNSFLNEKITPPKSLIELYLKKNSVRDLMLNYNFYISSSFVVYIINKLNLAFSKRINTLGIDGLITENGSNMDESDNNSEVYIEILTSNQEKVDKIPIQRISCNPFKNNINRAISYVFQTKEKFNQDDRGFLHHLLFKSVVDSVNTSPWNINHWKDLYYSLKNFILFLSKIGILDEVFGSGGIFFGLEEYSSIEYNEERLYYYKLPQYFTQNHYNEFSTNNSENVLLYENINITGIKRSIETLKKIMIQKQLYYRYFNFGNPQKGFEISEMLLLRIKVYTLLCVISEIDEVYRIKCSELTQYMSQNSVSTQDSVCYFCRRSVFWSYFVDKGNTEDINCSSHTHFSDDVLLFSTISVLFDHIPIRDLHNYIENTPHIDDKKRKDYLFISERWENFEIDLRNKNSQYKY
ncbi:hypothetical protein FG379_001506 [Cryptosporidium bovis]|uniref:uncharacterized protein n=1 Tax=Cryptosporidium bovis TaxID=310047 RepID=UPI00351A5C6A|nr:hypothetical protein FG379_001506 [Cryptosporidium bovis]